MLRWNHGSCCKTLKKLFYDGKRAAIKIGWATDGGGWDIKILKDFFNMEPRL